MCSARRLLSRKACDIRFIFPPHYACTSKHMLARVCMSRIKFDLVFLRWMHIFVTAWAKRKRTLTPLPYHGWVPKKGAKLEHRHCPPSNDARSRKRRRERGGPKPRKR